MDVWVEEAELFPVYTLWSEQPYLCNTGERKITVSMEYMNRVRDVMKEFYDVQREIGLLVRGGRP